MIDGDVCFKISYTTDSNGHDDHWSHDFVHGGLNLPSSWLLEFNFEPFLTGSTPFYVLENYTNDRGYLIQVSSVLGEIESANSGVLHVEAKYGSFNK